MAYELLTSISRNEQERIAFHSRRANELRRNSELEAVEQRGEQRAKRQNILNMLGSGFAPEVVANVLKAPVELVLELAQQ
ncbi:hypothetical protein FACS1894184_11050 [Clostridia bacterium]|nr:hypothetical protein FACS1894184_11050 [Clostridia bacterium]